MLQVARFPGRKKNVFLRKYVLLYPVWILSEALLNGRHIQRYIRRERRLVIRAKCLLFLSGFLKKETWIFSAGFNNTHLFNFPNASTTTTTTDAFREFRKSAIFVLDSFIESGWLMRPLTEFIPPRRIPNECFLYATNKSLSVVVLFEQHQLASATIPRTNNVACTMSEVALLSSIANAWKSNVFHCALSCPNKLVSISVTRHIQFLAEGLMSFRLFNTHFCS